MLSSASKPNARICGANCATKLHYTEGVSLQSKKQKLIVISDRLHVSDTPKHNGLSVWMPISVSSFVGLGMVVKIMNIMLLRIPVRINFDYLVLELFPFFIYNFKMIVV